MPPACSPDQDDDPTPFNVFVTGFGPFHTYRDNPSWLAVEPLTDHLMTRSPFDDDDEDTPAVRTRPIKITTQCITVTYQHAQHVVQHIHSSTQQHYDLVLHVGVGLSGAIRLEQRARRLGYMKPDINNQYAPQSSSSPQHRGFIDKHSQQLGDQLETTINLTHLINTCINQASPSSSGLSHQTLQQSNDAGLYLCEYTFYASQRSARLNKSTTRVQFVHVPPLGPNEPFTKQQLTKSIQYLIWTILNPSEG
ncbi:hypothetical protein OIO90_003322 [Microbotryomycetes sp. JL221]|nr:hypothetical protein OIO90_003322 [Microbotryomycetes sp. JL221]